MERFYCVNAEREWNWTTVNVLSVATLCWYTNKSKCLFTAKSRLPRNTQKNQYIKLSVSHGIFIPVPFDSQQSRKSLLNMTKKPASNSLRSSLSQYLGSWKILVFHCIFTRITHENWNKNLGRRSIHVGTK